MMKPRLLTNSGLGYYRGGLPAGGFADDAAMLAEYPLANSPKLRLPLGAAEMLDVLPYTWVNSPTDDQLQSFTAAGGAKTVTNSQGKIISCLTPAAVHSTFAVGGGTFHPSLDTPAKWSNRYIQYNDEGDRGDNGVWHGFDAGVRAFLFDRWSEFSATAPVGYGKPQRDADALAWNCAVEGLTTLFNGLRSLLPNSRWSIHLLPNRPNVTNSLPNSGSFLMDLNWGQTGPTSRWRGVGAADPSQAVAYADFWLSCAEDAFQPAADASDWICPRLYIDDRMRNWDQEVPGQSHPQFWTEANAPIFREYRLQEWSDRVELSVTIANRKPVYPAVVPTHPGSDYTDDPLDMGWYNQLSVDLESHREQMRRVMARCAGVSIWSSEDYIGRVAMKIGRDSGVQTTEQFRKNIKRRFPGLFDLPIEVSAENDALWRTTANWAAYQSAYMDHTMQMAQASALLGGATQSTLLQYI